jgi:hypothetical protein
LTQSPEGRTWTALSTPTLPSRPHPLKPFPEKTVPSLPPSLSLGVPPSLSLCLSSLSLSSLSFSLPASLPPCLPASLPLFLSLSLSLTHTHTHRPGYSAFTFPEDHRDVTHSGLSTRTATVIDSNCDSEGYQLGWRRLLTRTEMVFDSESRRDNFPSPLCSHPRRPQIRVLLLLPGPSGRRTPPRPAVKTVTQPGRPAVGPAGQQDPARRCPRHTGRRHPNLTSAAARDAAAVLEIFRCGDTWAPGLQASLRHWFKFRVTSH